MIVENSRKSTRLPKVVYLLISGLLLLLETFIFIDIKKYFKIKECLSRCGNIVQEYDTKKETHEILYSFFNARNYINNL